MALVQVITKNSEIDGKPITWKILAIAGTIEGETNTLELKLSKNEAILANLLLNSSSDVSTATHRATDAEQLAFQNNIKNTNR